MAKNKIFHLNLIWSIFNIGVAFLIWRRAVELDSNIISVNFNLQTYIIGFTVLNSILVFAATRVKQQIFGYLINALTLYILIMIIVEIYLVIG